jgi:HK97 family phage major capsid protein
MEDWEREETLRRMLGDDATTERSGTDDADGGTYEAYRGDATTAALRANDAETFLPERSREAVERALREDDDPQARLAGYVTELSNRDYLRAFSKYLNDPQTGGHTWTTREREAVSRVKWLSRAMNLTGASGGFLVPYALDPAIVLAGVGDVDVMRQVSNVSLSAYNVKSFVTSLGVTPHWYAEAAETSDDGPALLQPTITCRKAAAFIPVSFELFEDSDIVQQVGHVLADAKRVEEGRVFTLGNGTTEPKGIITALVAAGGATVIATGTNVLAQADLYANQAALPPRWRPNAKWMMNLSIINGFRQLPQAAGLNYSIINDNVVALPHALGWPLYENSNMDGTLTGAAADYSVLSGDFNQFAIVDRIGTSIEVIPHLFGASQRPTAQRGFYMHWRVGSDVLIPDAFRLTNYST